MEIVVKRPKIRWISMLMPIIVYLNGNKIGKIKRNKRLAITADSGKKNTLKFRCKGYGSKPVEVELIVDRPTEIIVKFNKELEKIFLESIFCMLLFLFIPFLLPFRNYAYIRILCALPVLLVLAGLLRMSQFSPEEYFDFEIVNLSN